MGRTHFETLRNIRDGLLRSGAYAWSGTLDLIYPTHCIICEREYRNYLCHGCFEKINLIEPPRCRRCGIPSQVYYCPECRNREFAFESNVSVGTYDGVLREAIHELKYNGRIVLAETLAGLMARCFATSGLANRVEVAVPIPIHRSRLVERGFNQSEELAKRFCALVGLPVVLGELVKRRRTRHQVDLPQKERLYNLEDAFALSGDSLCGKRVLLIDDVYTTGSTLHSAAGAIIRGGASIVYAYTLARSI